MEHVKLLSKYGTDYTLVVAENVMLRERCAALEARLAAMREAMERFKWYIENSDGFWMGDKCGAWALDDNQSLEYQVMELLNSDAGKAMLERLAKAEAERVEAVNLDDYCNTFACAMSCNKDKCSLWQMYCWLRDHGMIREAE